jgi:hypothetical protein
VIASNVSYAMLQLKYACLSAERKGPLRLIKVSAIPHQRTQNIGDISFIYFISRALNSECNIKKRKMVF